MGCGGKTYLAIANGKGVVDGVYTADVSSSIYEWYPLLKRFVMIQSVPTHGASGIEVFVLVIHQMSQRLCCCLAITKYLTLPSMLL